MHKFLLLLVYCVLAHTLAFSQEQDTIPPQPDSIAPVRRDTARRIIRPPVIRDTGRTDTARTDTISLAVVAPEKPGRDRVQEMRAMLEKHPYFNFFGPPLQQVAIVRPEPETDMFFYVLLGLFFYFAIIRVLFGKYLMNLVSIFLRITLRQQQLREQLLQAPLPSLLLNIFFLLSGGLYASLLLSYYKYSAHDDFWIQTLYCTGILALVYIGKFVILKFTGWVFGLSKATDTYIFIVFLVNKMLGLLLLPFLVLITFYGGQAQQVFVTLSLILIVCLFAYRFAFSFGPIRAEIKVNAFHFFLYLCAFEIAPLLLIYKVLLSILEKSN